MAYSDVGDAISPSAQPVELQHSGEGREAEALLAALVAFSRDAIISCTQLGIIRTWNDGAQRLFGWTAEEARGRSILFLVDALAEDSVRALLERTRAGQPSQLETEFRDKAGHSVEVSIGAAPVRDKRGKVIALSFLSRDLRRRRRSEANDAMLASVVRQSRDSIFSVNLAGIISTWNPASQQLYGYTPDEAIDHDTAFMVPDEKHEEDRAMFEAVLRGETVLYESIRRRKDGGLIDVSISGAPLRDAQGAIVGVSSIHRDITAQRQYEQQMRLVMRELAHRSKNLLAIIISMAGQTARNSTTISDFTARFTQRLQGLSHSHDLLIQQNWRGAPIRELIYSHLEPFLDGDDERITLDGPDVAVDPKAAQNIGLALHELATNASKYGALTQAEGCVDIHWRCDLAGFFILEWRESHGPMVVAPTERGFGQTVLERLAALALEGRSFLDFDPAGVVWRIEIPASYLVSPDTEAEFSL